MKKIAGLVLAGGKSSRMGQDKANLPIKDGRTMLQHACDIVRTIYSTCYVSCATGHVLAGVPCIEDNISGVGPLAGLIAALRFFSAKGYDAAHVLACDMPFMQSGTMVALRDRYLALDSNANISVAVWQTADNRLQMLCALYAVSALPFLEDACKTGKYSLKKIIPLEQTLRIRCPSEIEEEFFNCNYPEEYLRVIEGNQPIK